MEGKQVDFLDKEWKKLIDNYNEELRLLEYKIIQSMNSLIEKNATAMESLKSKVKYKNDSDFFSYSKEEIYPIIDLYKNINQRLNSLGKEMIKINDKIVFKTFIDKYKEIVETTKEEAFSKYEIIDKSSSEDYETESEFNNISENLQNNIYGFNEIYDDNNNFIPTEVNNFNITPGLVCTIHPLRRAEWTCRGHCIHKFCVECYNLVGNNTLHGMLQKINGIINNSPEARIFLERFKKIFSTIYTRCNVLINLKKFPDLKELDELNYDDLDLQIQFIMKVHDEYKKLGILSEENNEFNGQLYKIVQNICL